MSYFREGNGTALQYSCLENPMGGGAWWAAVCGVGKNRTRLSGFTFTFHFHALEKEMATHSSVLAWRILGTGEPGGLPSMGSHRVGHDWSNWAAAGAWWAEVHSVAKSRTRLKRLSTHAGTRTWPIIRSFLKKRFSEWGSQSFHAMSAYSTVKLNNTAAYLVYKAKPTLYHTVIL